MTFEAMRKWIDSNSVQLVLNEFLVVAWTFECLKCTRKGDQNSGGSLNFESTFISSFHILKVYQKGIIGKKENKHKKYPFFLFLLD